MAELSIATVGALSASADAGGFSDVNDPAGAIAVSIPDRARAFVNTVTAPTSGTLRMMRIYLRAGQVVTTVNFIAGGTVPTASSHLWVALYNPSLGLLSQSTDDTSAAPLTANVKKSINLGAAQTIATSGAHYVGFLETVSSGNMPTFDGVSNGLSAVAGELPQVYSDADAALTTTAPPTATLAGALTQWPYIWLT